MYSYWNNSDSDKLSEKNFVKLSIRIFRFDKLLKSDETARIKGE